MSYEPRKYWPARYAKEGALACAMRGMDAARSEAQMAAFWPHIEKRVPKPCPRLLDFGCGPGRLVPLVGPLVGEGAAHKSADGSDPELGYRGVDICPLAVSVAWDEWGSRGGDLVMPGNPHFAHMPDDRIPCYDAWFDCVVCCTSLQHIVDDAQFALWTREIDRVTCPGGTVVVLDGLGCKAAHCRSRTPGEVGLALGMAIEGEIGIVDAESKRSHWCAAFRKGPSVLVGALQEILRAPVVPVGLPGGEFVR